MGMTLDQWVKPSQNKKFKIVNDDHINQLYEQSFHRQLDKLYDAQIERFLAEEKKIEENHKKYIGNNYVRLGGNKNGS